MASGFNHTVALLSDGHVVAWGDNTAQQAHVPRSHKERYVDASAVYTTLPCSNGQAGLGLDTCDSSCQFAGYHRRPKGSQRGPEPRWSTVRMGQQHGGRASRRCRRASAIPTSPSAMRTRGDPLDGSACPSVHFSGEGYDPALPTGLRYEQVDVYYLKTLLLRSDGACSWGHVAVGSQLSPLPPDALRRCRGEPMVCGCVRMARSFGGVDSTPRIPSGGRSSVAHVSVTPDRGRYLHTALRRSDGLVDVWVDHCSPGRSRHSSRKPARRCLRKTRPPLRASARRVPTSRLLQDARDRAG
jgi:hypothetical protein